MIRLYFGKNLPKFLQMACRCSEAVWLMHADGSREDVRKPDTQAQLLRQFHKNGDWLRLTLDIRDPKDYNRLVLFAVLE